MPGSTLLPTIKMMHEFCHVLTDMERSGIKIDLVELRRLKVEYIAEKAVLERKLQQMATEAMGNIPINFDSPDDMSKLIYSREVTDKKLWIETFNIGAEVRNAVRKKKRTTHYPRPMFNRIVQRLTQVIYKRDSRQCTNCHGKGRVGRTRKDGTPSAERYICPECRGNGYVLVLRRPMAIAGLRILPTGVSDVSAAGFKASKDVLLNIAERAETEDAKSFFTSMVRLNAITTYLTNFVDGIERNMRGDGILHTSFMQAVTATGRLSSTSPNLHNQPRGATFPIRKVVVSRFPGGKILEGDYEQLEYRVAVELAGDKAGLADIREGVDAHNRTATVLTAAGQPTIRQDAKAKTFKPLYGGTTGTEAERAYYRWFLEHHAEIAEWHDALLQQAIVYRCIKIPSGREYAFPYAKRYPSGSVSNATQIKNYPVQGFATADIVPIACIEVEKRFRRAALKSVLINEIHDSIVGDIHSDEIDIAIKLMREGMLAAKGLVKWRYGYEMKVPLGVELKMGDNWLELKKVA